MLRLVLPLSLLLSAASATASTVRVRLASSRSTIAVDGVFDCGRGRVTNPKAKSVGPRLKIGRMEAVNARCAGQGRFTYRGIGWQGGAQLRVQGDSVILIGEIDIESYVAGVVAAELLPGWPAESLKAMAVAARSYTVWRMLGRKDAAYHLTADVSSQVFRGLERVPKPVREAVAATRGQVLKYRGKPVAAYYHACAAGRTATAGEVWGQDEPYLRAVISPDLACNRINWRSAMHTRVAGKKLGVGQLKQVEIVKRSVSHRVAMVRVVGHDGERNLSAQELRQALGWAILRSADFVAAIKGNQLVFDGHGSGHGVGLSQWGAKGMAERGKSYKAILSHYYPGTALAR